MASKSNGRCVYTQFDKKILCAGTMTHYLEILQRTIAGAVPGKTTQPTPSFIAIEALAGYLEVKKATPRWNGVSTEDQVASNFTHAAYISFDQTIYELDVSKLFIKKAGARDRYFKLKLIKNYDEEDQWIQMQLAETGFSDLEAAAV